MGAGEGLQRLLQAELVRNKQEGREKEGVTRLPSQRECRNMGKNLDYAGLV